MPSASPPPDAAKPLVLVIGGAGNTGQVIINTLLERGSFRVASLTRPASESKPAVAALKSKGVEIRLGDFVADSIGKLVEVVSGVDILISTVSAEAILEQKNIFDAAKKAGVKRIVPCDFGTACSPGLRDLYDEKLVIRAFLRKLGVPYTFIDVGWWMSLALPHPQGSPAGWIAEFSREVIGSGNVKTAVTDLQDIGSFVARIIQDPRTINQYVFCWGEHVTKNEAYELAERVSSQKLSDLKVPVSDEECLRRAVANRAKFQQKPDPKTHALWIGYQYAVSIYSRGDNTIEKAKAAGALDARELYPDFKPRTLEEVAKEFYTTGKLGYTYD